MFSETTTVSFLFFFKFFRENIFWYFKLQLNNNCINYNSSTNLEKKYLWLYSEDRSFIIHKKVLKNICDYSLELEIRKTLNTFNEKIDINEIISCMFADDFAVEFEFYTRCNQDFQLTCGVSGIIFFQNVKLCAWSVECNFYNFIFVFLHSFALSTIFFTCLSVRVKRNVN